MQVGVEVDSPGGPGRPWALGGDSRGASPSVTGASAARAAAPSVSTRKTNMQPVDDRGRAFLGALRRVHNSCCTRRHPPAARVRSPLPEAPPGPPGSAILPRPSSRQPSARIPSPSGVARASASTGWSGNSPIQSSSRLPMPAATSARNSASAKIEHPCRSLLP